jgi:predicted PhzF superfamily epimerase YddE/YHI9
MVLKSLPTQHRTTAKVHYAIIDVFSTTPYRGKRLAVVDNTSETLKDDHMKLISRELNLPATTFFNSVVPGVVYHLHSFLPTGTELVDPVGHHTIGAWWHLANSGLLDFSSTFRPDRPCHPDEYLFIMDFGSQHQLCYVKVRRTLGPEKFVVTLRQADAEFGRVSPDGDGLVASLGIQDKHIGWRNLEDIRRLRPQVVVAGRAKYLYVPVSSLDNLRRVSDKEDGTFNQLRTKSDQETALVVFCRHWDNTYHARCSNQPGLAGEDPASPNAAGLLAAYLHRHRCLGLRADASDVDDLTTIWVRQGKDVGKDCVMQVVLRPGDGFAGGRPYSVEIAGGAVEVASGMMVVPSLGPGATECWKGR